MHLTRQSAGRPPELQAPGWSRKRLVARPPLRLFIGRLLDTIGASSRFAPV